MKHKVISIDSEVPANIDILVGMVSKTADETGYGWLRTLSVRMPALVASRIEGLALHSGQSRNKLVVKIIEVGLESLWNALPDNERDSIEALSNECLTQWMQDGASQESGEV